MDSRIRKARAEDLEAVSRIYEHILTEQEQGRVYTGWERGVYPTAQTAMDALEREDLFVQEDGGRIVGAAIINRQQVDVYAGAPWQYPAAPEAVTVLHTLVIDPDAAGRGLGKQFVAFYEDYAIQNGCKVLRMDTNSRNLRARAMYGRLGYREAGIVPCVFNGIAGVALVLLEKMLDNL